MFYPNWTIAVNAARNQLALPMFLKHKYKNVSRYSTSEPKWYRSVSDILVIVTGF